MTPRRFPADTRDPKEPGNRELPTVYPAGWFGIERIGFGTAKPNQLQTVSKPTRRIARAFA
jgi:hypothetical protein